jgi:hypothetical protein
MTQNTKSFTDELQAAFGELEQSRLEALRRLRELQIFRQSCFEEEIRRLGDKLGYDHPRAERIKKEKENKKLIELIEKSIAIQLHALNAPQESIAKKLGKSKTWVNTLLRGISKKGGSYVGETKEKKAGK